MTCLTERYPVLLAAYADYLRPSQSAGPVLFTEAFVLCHFSSGVNQRRHVQGHVSVQLDLSALPQTGAGAPGLGGSQASVGSQESHDQSSAGAARAPASAQDAAPPGGPSASGAGPVSGRGRPQHLHVWRHEGGVRRAEGPGDGQRPDGDGAGGDGVDARDGYVYNRQQACANYGPGEHTGPVKLFNLARQNLKKLY